LTLFIIDAAAIIDTPDIDAIDYAIIDIFAIDIDIIH
jgi:hypothetical protein